MAYGTYTASESRAYTTGITMLEISNAATQLLLITRAWCTQSSSTTSAQQRIELLRKSAAGTLTNTLTPAKVTPGSAASGVTSAKTTATVEGTATDILIEDSFNVLQGWLWVPSCPEERIVVAPSGIIALKLPAAPAASITFSYGLEWIELG